MYLSLYILLICVAFEKSMALKCQVGYQTISSTSQNTVKTQKLTECPQGRQSCVRLAAPIPGFGRAIYYACATRQRCSSLTCESSKQFIKSSMGSRHQIRSTFKGCRIKCCEENNCNSVVGNKNTKSRTRTTLRPRVTKATPPRPTNPGTTIAAMTPPTPTTVLHSLTNTTLANIITTMVLATPLGTADEEIRNNSSTTTIIVSLSMTVQSTGASLTTTSSANSNSTEEYVKINSTLTTDETIISEILSKASKVSEPEENKDLPPPDDAFPVTEKVPKSTALARSSNTKNTAATPKTKLPIHAKITAAPKTPTTSEGLSKFRLKLKDMLAIIFCTAGVILTLQL